jgi:hypothetical protein
MQDDFFKYLFLQGRGMVNFEERIAQVLNAVEGTRRTLFGIFASAGGWCGSTSSGSSWGPSNTCTPSRGTRRAFRTSADATYNGQRAPWGRVNRYHRSIRIQNALVAKDLLSGTFGVKLCDFSSLCHSVRPSLPPSLTRLHRGSATAYVPLFDPSPLLSTTYGRLPSQTLSLLTPFPDPEYPILP